MIAATFPDRRPPTRRRKAAAKAFSVVIPAYNEEQGIEATLQRLNSSLAACDQEYEIIIVNDASTDHTSRLLRSRRNIRLVEHETNLGYGASLKTGIRHARHPLVVIVDADNTYPLEDIPQLLKLAEDADMVVGARIGRNSHHPPLRRIPKWFLTRFAEWIARRPIPDLNSGMRVFRKSVVERFLNILPNGFSFTTTITLALLTNGYRVRYEPIDYHPRLGRSKVRPVKDTLVFLQLILRTGAYFAPLRVFLPVAAVFFMAFLLSVGDDVFIHADLTERSLTLLIAATQLGMFALLADMIDKRSG